jgi:hypothetical protein
MAVLSFRFRHQSSPSIINAHEERASAGSNAAGAVAHARPPAWCLRNGGHTQSGEIRDDSAAGDGWLVLFLSDGEPIFGRRCGDAHGALYVAECLRQDCEHDGWRPDTLAVD